MAYAAWNQGSPPPLGPKPKGGKSVRKQPVKKDDSTPTKVEGTPKVEGAPKAKPKGD